MLCLVLSEFGEVPSSWNTYLPRLGYQVDHPGRVSKTDVIIRLVEFLRPDGNSELITC